MGDGGEKEKGNIHAYLYNLLKTDVRVVQKKKARHRNIQGSYVHPTCARGDFLLLLLGFGGTERTGIVLTNYSSQEF